MLSDFANFLWSFLGGLVNSVLSWFSSAFSGLESFLSSIFGSLFSFLSGLIQSLLNGITNFLKWLFQPIFDLIAAIFHLVVKLIQLLGLLLDLFLQLGHVIIAFIQGLFATLAGLSYDGSTPSVDQVTSNTLTAMSGAFSILQLDNIAYILLFVIWLITAITVVRMVGNFRG